MSFPTGSIEEMITWISFVFIFWLALDLLVSGILIIIFGG